MDRNYGLNRCNGFLKRKFLAQVPINTDVMRRQIRIYWKLESFKFSELNL